MAISEVAYLLGYSEPSAFHRAFRRWTGVTPGEYRAPHAAAAEVRTTQPPRSPA
jgi:AraC-like DNA-binding protein